MSTTVTSCCHLQVLESLVLRPKPTVASDTMSNFAKAGFAAEIYGKEPLEEPLLAKEIEIEIEIETRE